MGVVLQTDYIAIFRKHAQFIFDSLATGLSMNKLAKALSEKEGYPISNQILRIRIKSDFHAVKNAFINKPVVRVKAEMPAPNQCKVILDDWTLCQNNIERGVYCEKHYEICYKKDSYKKCVKK